jgi:hypothetical protein
MTTDVAALTDTLTAFFDQCGTALTHGDVQALSSCYATPGLLVSAETNVAFTSSVTVEAAFAVASRQHSGLIAARAVVRSAEQVTPGVVLADVDWEYLDSEGQAVPGISYRYVLRMLKTGPRICVVIPRAAPADSPER